MALEHGISAESMTDIPTHIDYWHGQITQAQGPLIDGFLKYLKELTGQEVTLRYQPNPGSSS